MTLCQCSISPGTARPCHTLLPRACLPLSSADLAAADTPLSALRHKAGRRRATGPVAGRWAGSGRQVRTSRSGAVTFSPLSRPLEQMATDKADRQRLKNLQLLEGGRLTISQRLTRRPQKVRTNSFMFSESRNRFFKQMALFDIKIVFRNQHSFLRMETSPRLQNT